ncbi:MAG: Hpt domain-containing protein [Gammaproteobacteria bacterium]|nr:Hpt domain-containing protein [Gammaproteobacteria bacterium]
MPNTLPILDLKQAIQYVSGNEPLAHELLQIFIKELPKYKQIIQQNFQDNNREELKEVIHKMNGGLSYVSAPALSQILSETDSELLTLSQAQLNVNINMIYNEIERIITIGVYI